ncbi:MAG TPA: tyrosine-type recombinase/integrase [Micromonosporaceae bacterium]|nr:tyrosine-type recombinase/integrase [Micromonosporaceae bacterium]
MTATLAPTLQAFFTDRLVRQRGASAHTIAAYRDTMRLLLLFAQQRLRKPPSTLNLADLDAPLVGAFLDHLQHVRGNSVRTRNARLAAIHSLFKFAALRHPEHAALIARVLAIAPKRFDKALITYLSPADIQALLAAPDRLTRAGRRDHALLLLAVRTGLRVCELVSLNRADVHLSAGAHVDCLGKGRKHRSTPLDRQTAAVLKIWLDERGGDADDPLFPTRTGGRLSPDAVQRLVTKHATTAGLKAVTPHVLRHTTVICSASAA